MKDVELLVLQHELAILLRQVAWPKLAMADRALLTAAAVHLPRAATVTVAGDTADAAALARASPQRRHVRRQRR